MELDLNDYLTAVAFSEGEWGSGDVRYYLPDNVEILFDEEFVISAQKDLQKFEDLMGDDLEKLIEEYKDSAKVAYDFWFSRNHHGTGFWEVKSTLREKADQISTQLGEVEEVIFLPIAQEYFVHSID